MKTRRWFVDCSAELSTTDPQITQAAELLRQNEVVAFPTETVYGLGANAENTEAVTKIYIFVTASVFSALAPSP